MIERWHDGFDVVYAKRMDRKGESFMKKVTAKYFYRIIRRVGPVEVPPDTGDFRLLSRRAVDSLRRLREHNRYMKGLFAWIGYPQTAVLYNRDARFAGDSKWNFWKLWNFAIDGMTSFTTGPLKIASYLGILTAAIAFVYAVWIIYKTLRFGEPVAGYPSLLVIMLFLGAYS